MNVLLIEEDNDARDLVAKTLQEKFPGKVSVVFRNLLQEGIELLEQQEELFDIIIFDYRGTGQALVKCLLGLGGKTTYIMLTPDPTNLAAFQKPGLALDIAIRSALPQSLVDCLGRLGGSGMLAAANTPDADFIPLKPEVLVGMSPIKIDIYVRLAQDRYVRLFKKGDQIDGPDIEKYGTKKQIKSFFIRKSEYPALLKNTAENIDRQAASPALTEPEADKTASASHEAVAEIVDRVGFTPEAQAIAKSSVAMTLKVLGARPKLAAILTRMRQDDGKYITSHSLVLGKIACAMAFKLGWSSAATFLKLSLASFLHDLPLRNNQLAAMRTLEEAKKSGLFNEQDLQAFKMHPMKAAEFARQFNEIPADVDVILMQHHEQPDGTGFPRGLASKFISPLGALFIIAHEMMHFTNSRPKDAPLEEFFTLYEERFSTGPFKKIFKALKEDSQANP